MTLSSVVMLFVVLLQLFSVSKADRTVKCVNESYSRTVFEPSADGVPGRYDIEWCTVGNVNSTQWNLVLSYNLAKKEKNCSNRTQPAQKHSEFKQRFESKDVNCTHMCFSTTLDMVFSGCFLLENWLPAMGSHRNFFGKYITNDYTRESFVHNSINADASTHEKEVTVFWHLGNVVASAYDMSLCSENPKAASGEGKYSDCKIVTDNCTVIETNPHEIVCTLRDLNGSYYMTLKHNAPWTMGGVFISQVFSHFSFEVTSPLVSVSRPASRTLAWGCGALLVLSAACAAAVCGLRMRRTRRLQQTVLEHWLDRKPGIQTVVTDNTTRSVLLLYAREGDLGEPLVRAIRDLLQSARVQVLDLYSPDVVSVSASSPGEWVRAQLEARDVSVLLLQTPSLAAIYGDRALPPSPGAEAALLHRRVRVVQAEPAHSDQLLSMALRLLAEDVHTATPYNKYFLATLDSLETDTLPYIVPFRRYGLPTDAARLVLDIQPGTVVHDDELAVLRHEANAFVQHVRANPGYLKDHLLILE